MDCVIKVSKATAKAPLVAFITMIKSLQCEWVFVQTVVLDCAETFLPLQDVTRMRLVRSLVTMALPDFSDIQTIDAI